MATIATSAPPASEKRALLGLDLIERIFKNSRDLVRYLVVLLESGLECLIVTSREPLLIEWVYFFSMPLFGAIFLCDVLFPKRLTNVFVTVKSVTEFFFEFIIDHLGAVRLECELSLPEKFPIFWLMGEIDSVF